MRSKPFAGHENADDSWEETTKITYSICAVLMGMLIFKPDNSINSVSIAENV